MYSAGVRDLPPNGAGTEKSLLWWRHPYYRAKWKPWHASWRKLKDEIPANQSASPANVIARLKPAQCDPDVALRLAFLVVTEKPSARSELAGDNARQQNLKRKLGQAGKHLQKAAFGLMEAALPEFANDNRKRTRKLDQSRNHIQTGAGELQLALAEMPLISIKPQDVESLKALAKAADPQDVALWMRLQDLASMCDQEIEALLWPRAPELPRHHELFTLVSYVTACSGRRNYSLVVDLLNVVREAYELTRPTTDRTTEPLTHDAVEQRVKWFGDLDSGHPGQIEESTAKRATSGELRSWLLDCYPD